MCIFTFVHILDYLIRRISVFEDEMTKAGVCFTKIYELFRKAFKMVQFLDDFFYIDDMILFSTLQKTFVIGILQYSVDLWVEYKTMQTVCVDDISSSSVGQGL